MIPVRQRGDSDCARASIASILERDYEAVPDFLTLADARGKWWGLVLDEWLQAEGYPFRHGNFMFNRGSSAPLEHVYTVSFWLGQPWWFATVAAQEREGLHAIVMHGDEVAWDPWGTIREPYDFIAANFFVVPEPATCRFKAQSVEAATNSADAAPKAG